MTYVNLQGDLDQKYQVGFHLSDKPKRQNQKASWPESREDNLQRLKEAGMPMERGIPKCNRCDGKPSWKIHCACHTFLTMFQSLVIPLVPVPRSLRAILIGLRLNASIARRWVIEPVTVLLLVRIDLPVETASKFPIAQIFKAPGLRVGSQSGHSAAECTEPRSAEGVECRKCNESELRIMLLSSIAPDR